MGVVWCDGTFLKEEDFKISPRDRGLCHGLSLFETMLGVNGRVRLLDEHLARLNDGLDRFGVRRLDFSARDLDSAMSSLMEENDMKSGLARIRFAVSMGEGALNELDSGEAWAWMTVACVDQLGGSVRMTEAPWKRDSQGILCGLKVGNYAENLVAMDFARRGGFDEILFYNSAGELCEAAMANVFLIHGNRLSTPCLDSGCLPGVTRAEVIRISGELGLQCDEKILSAKDVAMADGMFLTSSIKGPVWVSLFDGKRFPEDENFRNIRDRWQDRMLAEGT